MPESQAIRQRAYDQGSTPAFLSLESKQSLGALRRLLLPHPDQSVLQIRVNATAMTGYQIVRADNEMVVASYLMRRTGSPSPTILLRSGGENCFFASYLEHFNEIWYESEDYLAPQLRDEAFLKLLFNPEFWNITTTSLDAAIDLICTNTNAHEYTIRRGIDSFVRVVTLLEQGLTEVQIGYVLALPEAKVERFKELYELNNTSDSVERMNLLKRRAIQDAGDAYTGLVS